MTAGCKDKTRCVTTDYTIINRIESDIVVGLKFGDRRTITIEPGETRMFYTGVQCYEEGVAYSMTPEILDAEMRIDGEVVPRKIWWGQYWDVESVGNDHVAYTLTVTDELLETIDAQ